MIQKDCPDCLYPLELHEGIWYCYNEFTNGTVCGYTEYEDPDDIDLEDMN